MSTQKVLVNDTVRIRVRFVDIDPITQQEINISPISVSVNIYDSSSEEIIDTLAVSETSYIYYYDFTPTLADTYNVAFTGYLEGGSTIVVQQRLYVSSFVEDYKPVTTLKIGETITFAPDVTPLYVDPESIVQYYPDATLIEIGELVHLYSLEVKDIYGLLDDDNGQSLPFIAYEYIKAATACELSRTYEFGGDDEVSVTLGDLSVVNRSLPRTKISRDNATTWCQIATAYRKELLSFKVSPRNFQPKGSPSNSVFTSGGVRHPDTGKVIYLSDRELYGPGRKFIAKEDPMPDRDLRSYD